MPTYSFRCAKGHESDGLYTISKRPDHIRCKCGRRAKRVPAVREVPITGDIEKNDIPQHFNPAFGTLVRNKKHYRHLQKVHGTQDWRPVRDTEPVERMLKRTGKAGRYER